VFTRVPLKKAAAAGRKPNSVHLHRRLSPPASAWRSFL